MSANGNQRDAAPNTTSARLDAVVPPGTAILVTTRAVPVAAGASLAGLAR